MNNNTFLSRTLPSKGTTLTNYYGTVHHSLDNDIALVLAAQVIWRIDRASVTSPTAHHSHRGLPGWLLKPSTPTHEVLSASAQRFHLVIEGDAARVGPSSLVSATVMKVGPQTPSFLAPPRPSATATLTMTLSDNAGGATLRARDFVLIDGNARI